MLQFQNGDTSQHQGDSAAISMYRTAVFETFIKKILCRRAKPMCSAYHAPSNGRAEVAVKTVKRALDTDTFARALLLLRNTPDRDTGTSPAELLILFGRRLRNALPQPYGLH